MVGNSVLTASNYYSIDKFLRSISARKSASWIKIKIKIIVFKRWRVIKNILREKN